MSEVLHIQDPSIWMPHNTPFGQRMFNNVDVGDAYSYNPTADPTTAQSADAWQQLYGGENQAHQQFSHQSSPMTQPQQQRTRQSPQNRIKQKRALSHSGGVTTLYESRTSPMNRTGVPSQSATFDGAAPPVYEQQAPFDHDSSAAFARQHPPTPSQTPTSDSFALDHRAHNKNRSKSAAHAESHRSMQSGMLDQLSFDSNHLSRSPGLLSVSSYGPDMPATPRTINSDGGEDPYNVASGELDTYPFCDLTPDFGSYFEDLALRPPSRLTRPYSDLGQDELYNPIATNITSAPAHVQHSQPQKSSLLSPWRNMVSDRLQAAHDARTSISPAENGSRNASPFRQGSRYANSSNGYAPIQGQVSAARSQHMPGQMAYADAGYSQQQAQQQQQQQQQTQYQQEADDSQKTISPKDAVLDFHEPEEQPASSLFPENSYERIQATNNSHQLSSPAFDLSSQAFNFQAPVSLPASLPQSGSQQEYRFPPSNFRQHSTGSEQPLDFPAHLISMETTRSEHESDSPAPNSPAMRPDSTNANTGTYTCTYNGCTQRFASPALLQRHKKEGHRSTAARAKSQSPSEDPVSPTSPYRNSQAGPHRCDHINPSTGKPCNVVFSRPYDLTRHEDTIHAQRTKVRCQYCNEEKTFSRSDALTRHMRVVHPQINFPGKHRRRNAA